MVLQQVRVRRLTEALEQRRRAFDVGEKKGQSSRGLKRRNAGRGRDPGPVSSPRGAGAFRWPEPASILWLTLGMQARASSNYVPPGQAGT
jgi:hypothetical protein